MVTKFKDRDELAILCEEFRRLVLANRYNDCYDCILEALIRYPHAPQPHNFLGILLLKKGDKATAIKHFLAAEALDPTYEPARLNLENQVSPFAKKRCFFDETDCPTKTDCKCTVKYTDEGVGQVIRKNFLLKKVKAYNSFS